MEVTSLSVTTHGMGQSFRKDLGSPSGSVFRRDVGVSSVWGCLHSPACLWEAPAWPQKWPCSTAAPPLATAAQAVPVRVTVEPGEDSESCPSPPAPSLSAQISSLKLKR